MTGQCHLMYSRGISTTAIQHIKAVSECLTNKRLGFFIDLLTNPIDTLFLLHIFDNMALYFECQINRKRLAILPTGLVCLFN